MAAAQPGASPSHRRLWLALVALVAAVAAALVLPGILDQPSVPAPTAKLVGDAVWKPATHPAPNFTLPTPSGSQVRLSSLRGHMVLVTFMDSLCTTDCPVEATELSLMQRKVKLSQRPIILIVSTDPAGDTPANVNKFIARYHLGAPYYWLVGTRAQLAAVWRHYDIEVTSASTHSSAIYLIDRWGNERVGWGIPFPVSDFDQSVRRLSAHYSPGWRWPWEL
ncbi:MAG: SCO family protein [Candidatus Dormibacteria bacterium]